MKTQVGVVLWILATALGWAQERYVTLTSQNPPSPPPVTNSLSIAEGEVAEVISIGGLPADYFFEKNGSRFYSVFSADRSGRGTLVAGPASFFLTADGPNHAAFMSLKILPASDSTGKSVAIPQHKTGVSVSLETSTNALDWVSATNGVYATTNEPRFFRIKTAAAEPAAAR